MEPPVSTESAVSAASSDQFVRLARALDRLPNGYPPTSSGVEIEILKAIFAVDEAAIAATMTDQPEPVEQIAARLGLEPETARKKLLSMVGRGLLWMMPLEGKRAFRLAPFVVGIYEAQRSRLDHRLAHLVEEYMTSPEGLSLIMSVGPALHRVVPARGAVKLEWVLPYDDVKAMILASQTFRLNDCICRLQQDRLGQRKCGPGPLVPGDLRRIASAQPRQHLARGGPGDLGPGRGDRLGSHGQ